MTRVKKPALLGTKQVMEILGYSNPNSVYSAIRAGSIPEPDMGNEPGGIKKWKTKTIEAFIGDDISDYLELSA